MSVSCGDRTRVSEAEVGAVCVKTKLGERNRMVGEGIVHAEAA